MNTSGWVNLKKKKKKNLSRIKRIKKIKKSLTILDIFIIKHFKPLISFLPWGQRPLFLSLSRL